MRLINTTTLKIQEHPSDKPPPYAILSHTWHDEECTLQHMQVLSTLNWSTRKGYTKIKLCCEQAKSDGLQWAWVDTCCIDKTSTAELSEAINSMFRWYRGAELCYAYLADVSHLSELGSSRWWLRGWTLQELIAPATVRFYDSKWDLLGSKLDLQHEIHCITRIGSDVLAGRSLESISVATRMSWAANRETTRTEDLAYCLMGLFDVNMPLLYGEGTRSFIRLQEEIMKMHEDHSLFAWGLPTKVLDVHEYLRANLSYGPDPFSGATPALRGLFASSPAEFASSERVHALDDRISNTFPAVSGNGVRIELQLIAFDRYHLQFAVLYCTMLDLKTHYIAVPLLPWGGKWFARCGELVSIHASKVAETGLSQPVRQPTLLLIKAPSLYEATTIDSKIAIVFPRSLASRNYTLNQVYCAQHAAYSAQTHTMTLSQNPDALHAIFFFNRIEFDPVELIPVFDRSYLKGRITRAGKLDFTRNEPNRVTVHGSKSEDRWTITCPNFAVVVGGTWQDPWTEIVHLLDDNNPAADFERLSESGIDMTCAHAVKQQLLSSLDSKTHLGPLRGIRRQTHRAEIMRWTFTLQREGSGLSSGPRDFKGQDGLVLNVELRKVMNNLVERSRVLLMEIQPLPAGDPRYTQYNAGWWQFDGSDNSSIGVRTEQFGQGRQN